MTKINKKTVHIKGMHCPSCEILITDKFKEMPNVVQVKSNFNKQEAEVYFTGHLDQNIINKKIQPYGYEIGDRGDKNEDEEPLNKKIFEAFLITIGLVLIYLIAKEINIVPAMNITGNLNLLTILFLGLVASISTCMATSGALFLSTIGRKTNNLKQAIYFSSGRIISYSIFGFFAGLIGSVIIINFKFGSILTLLAAIFMILLGLDMLKILSFAAVIPYGVSSNVFRKLENRLIKDPHKSAFLLGLITYFLPCGFTQATQVYALGLASPWQSALTMAVFAVGTAPAILLIGNLRSLLKSTVYQYFMKVVAVGILILGLYYATNFLSIYGINIRFNQGIKGVGTNANIENGKQIINMAVVSGGYVPNYFTVKKGMPVKWIIDGKNVFGCQGYFIVPSLNISKALNAGENLIEFTPTETGFINFSCGMGMYRGRIEVVD
ncbi:MAG: heavy metal transport/detoxification protein [Candidatus Roizmanbacteria bacterium GW2011_GWA2_34_18]|uniref:Heavy metal transport/detoxification protein n=1 Tax=Candidatus Roizmanbacteria bacterium GW2011_GWA2_34_18 TaxID=1618477 RepID=A0A0G0DZJ0_9BACT|nr:MAG: heavy metal transport/detoxification protein [Candidatus Roizmanbacteria bacterium GW2011_GWA2_34_18]